MSENEGILEMLNAEHAKIQAVTSQLAKKGMHMRAFIRDESKGILEQLHVARQEMQFLDKLISSNPTLVAPPSPSPALALAVTVQAAAPAHALVTKLTDAEASRLNWTEQVRYAQGKLSDTEARDIIANRQNPKKGQSLTEQCIAITGGKDQIDRTV